MRRVVLEGYVVLVINQQRGERVMRIQRFFSVSQSTEKLRMVSMTKGQTRGEWQNPHPTITSQHAQDTRASFRTTTTIFT